jgi:hypothetical protein
MMNVGRINPLNFRSRFKLKILYPYILISSQSKFFSNSKTTTKKHTHTYTHTLNGKLIINLSFPSIF